MVAERFGQHADAETIVIYHANCIDGFGAAWAAHEMFGDNAASYLPASYGDEAPDTEGKHVVIVDFSYPTEVMEQLADECLTLTLLDHHQSAIERLNSVSYMHRPNVSGRLDGTVSGALLTWQWYCGHKEAPQLLRHISDRDLWQFALPDTREIIAGLAIKPRSFAVWSNYMGMDLGALQLTLGVEGTAILASEESVLSTLERNARMLPFDAYLVPMVNAPPQYASELGDRLAKGHPFAVVYWDDAAGRHVSLRSTSIGQDVAAIAQLYGGGGHRNAAGFVIARPSYPLDGAVSVTRHGAA